MKEHIFTYIKNDGTITLPEGKEIDSMVKSLIAVYNGLKINKLLGVGEEANKKTWADSVSGILGTTTEIE
ncbi:hypothetical protein [Candidatus Nitrosocosmicus arcticus]|uniref:Uncharacterized protein n=1 Tax=Candidatus Nitrosocosmicus arcticus TaxID=2035267 RepID=A0A557SSH7_9ARCH|nr:hypothetical protein [Candidatus Nitrosocosmicus arcticus]TVP39559.1 hypothetical protein NARC_140014 [Candidatus Nitrosocosmicus arcticus]